MCGMLKAFLQSLTVSTKGDTLSTEAIQRSGLIQGVTLSTILFLLYIDYIWSYGTMPLDELVDTKDLGNA